jgi:hypothetical protein
LGLIGVEQKLRQCFVIIVITTRASAVCWLQAAPDLTDNELQHLFTALDVDNTGSVDSQEFFAGVLQAALLPQQTHTVLEASFKLLDRWAAERLDGCVKIVK